MPLPTFPPLSPIPLADFLVKGHPLSVTSPNITTPHPSGPMEDQFRPHSSTLRHSRAQHVSGTFSTLGSQVTPLLGNIGQVTRTGSQPSSKLALELHDRSRGLILHQC
eukprot:Lithocolla_globosa_v1_NODE_3207_length_1733_cov_151.573897.p4 type:complete len:108 gc:universal NODE_3207_length_1733_cov_151.573897:1112-789(-)